MTGTLHCAHLLPFVLGQVGLELEVRLELVGTKLALVGAVHHHELLGLSVVLSVLVGQRLHLDWRMTALHIVPVVDRWISLSLARTVLQLLWCLCGQTWFTGRAVHLTLNQQLLHRFHIFCKFTATSGYLVPF